MSLTPESLAGIHTQDRRSDFAGKAPRSDSIRKTRVRFDLQNRVSDSQPERDTDDVSVEIAIDVPEKERSRIEQHILRNQLPFAEVADGRTLEPIEDAQERVLDDREAQARR